LPKEKSYMQQESMWQEVLKQPFSWVRLYRLMSVIENAHVFVSV